MTDAPPEDYRDVHRAYWDDRAAAHAASSGYDVQRFADDPESLSDVVRFDLPRLGDVRGLTGVHLQCHIGTDTVSLARLGATMTGLDLSSASLEQARRIAALAGADVTYVEGEVYRAAELLPAASFDLVFTGVGALCWIPDIRRWAQVVAALLKPGGRLFLREGHPVLWAVDENREDDLLVLRYPYVETPEPVRFDEDGTYVETEASFSHNLSLSWNHGLAETITALFDVGMRITALAEHDSAPWEALPGKMTRVDLDEWALTEGRERLPLTYTLQAVKEG